MDITITQERPDTPDAVQLITELEATLEPHYPTESRHGYSVETLLEQGVAFFVVRRGDVPAGCGGVQIYGEEYAELKRMYVRPAHRGLGLAKRLVEHLGGYSLERGVPVLRLETGIYQEAAIGLYERMGFTRIGPFGEYRDDPLSVFMEKRLG
jgi:GNAT superfamily N-acetyltransferase